jgi:hypothetical protein
MRKAGRASAERRSDSGGAQSAIADGCLESFKPLPCKELRRCWIDHAHDASHNLFCRCRVECFDVPSGTVLFSRLDIKRPYLVAHCNAACIVTGNRYSQPGIPRKLAAARNGNRHGHTKRVDFLWRDNNETMPVLHFATSNWIRVNPIHVPALWNPAPNHGSSRPTDSPSRAHAVSALISAATSGVMPRRSSVSE